jgi:high-affinity iron transporter
VEHGRILYHMPNRVAAPLARAASLVGVLLGLLLLGPGSVSAAPEDDLRALNAYLDQASAALSSGDVAGARAAYAAYDAGWLQIEDGVKARSRPAYRSIEDAMSDVKIGLRTEPVDRQRAAAALLELERRGEQFSAEQQPASETAAGETAAADSQARLRGLTAYLDRAEAGLRAGDSGAAASELRGFQRAWPEVEGLVRAKSPAVYAGTENAMAEAQARLGSTPPDPGRAHDLIATIRSQLAPLAEESVSYGVFDATIIMLREGLEALLVIAALLAFLQKAGRPEQQRWIWSGGLAGVALSVAVAFGAQAAFSRAGAALGSELVEGLTGLVGAAMLFYVSYWLHQKSRLGAWQRYIRERSGSALARNSVLSLAMIAFLAVFREGAKTVLFYLGIAPSIPLGDLLAGIGLGTGLLLVIGIALLALGLRLPLRPFFQASSLLIYYLGFKFVGTGIHALQVAGVLPATPAPLPANEVLGLFPTWQTVLPQLVLLVVALVIAAYSLRRSQAGAAVAA